LQLTVSQYLYGLFYGHSLSPINQAYHKLGERVSGGSWWREEERVMGWRVEE
jgi:hypothetical protein